MASGSVSATSSTSMPPMRDSIAIGFFADAVEHDGGVVLLVDLARLLHPDLVDGEAADVHPEDGVRRALGLGAVLGELDPAGLAAPADQHLGLDHDRVAELLGGLDGLVHGRRVAAVGHGDAVLREELLALVFEEVHFEV